MCLIRGVNNHNIQRTHSPGAKNNQKRRCHWELWAGLGAKRTQGMSEFKWTLSQEPIELGTIRRPGMVTQTYLSCSRWNLPIWL